MIDLPPAPTTSSPGGSRVRGALGLLAGWLLAAALLGAWMLGQAHTLLFAGLETLVGWAALGAVIRFIAAERPRPGFLAFGQWALLGIGIALVAGATAPVFRAALPLEQVNGGTLRSLAVLLLGAAAVLHFFANYARLVQGPADAPLLAPVLPLARVACLACASAAASLFLYGATQRDFSSVLGGVFLAFSLLLLLETLLRLAARFYTPRSQRGAPPLIGASVILDTLGGSSRSLRALVAEMEKLLGTRLGDSWIARFLARAAEPMLLGAVLLAWLSTCLTAVPLGSRGVLVSFGQYVAEPLAPGLHVTLPWPLQDVALVETDRVREISLGFEQDLAGPVLWTEPHYVGEQNLLVGDGESLLTIDVPIQYQVADPVAFLTATSDPAAALKSLAERRLVQAAQSRESFAIMTSGRTQIAAEIEQGLQEEADRHGLGLKILFVGLKDVHPPVDVAPAYEKVVSSQERKEAAIDLARAYEAQVLPDAQTDANRLISDAGAAATQRLDQATGEARRFTLLASAEQEAPELLRLRWRYDVLDQGLAGPGKFIVGLSGAQAPGTYLDFRGQKDVPLAPPTGSALPAPPPLPDRGTRKEMPER